MYQIYCRTVQFFLRIAAYFLPWRYPEELKDYHQLALLLKKKQINSVLLVTGKNVSRLGLYEPLLKALEIVDISVAVYNETVPDPTIDNVEAALQLYKSKNCSAIIAFGGGSPMDCAKIVGARVARPNKTVSQMRGVFKVLRKIPLFVAIPTTAGTGSETTIAAVITDSITHEKYAVSDLALIPHYTILDPKLTVGMPPHITAFTGMDALCHAVEAYIGRNNTQQTRKDALQAAKLIFENLYPAFCAGTHLTARINMQMAAYQAGRAFTRAYVGYVHAIGHALGARYGISHGFAMAVILPQILELYGKAAHKRLSEIAVFTGIGDKNESQEKNSAKFIETIRKLNASMGIPNKIDVLKEEDIPELSKIALKEANPLYPVPLIFDMHKMEQAFFSLLKCGTNSNNEL